MSKECKTCRYWEHEMAEVGICTYYNYPLEYTNYDEYCDNWRVLE